MKGQIIVGDYTLGELATALKALRVERFSISLEGGVWHATARRSLPPFSSHGLGETLPEAVGAAITAIGGAK